MGMFDTIIVSLDKLPVSDDEREMLRSQKHLWWQTKDFECVLTEIYITDDGELKENQWHYEEVPKEERPYPDAEDIRSIIGSIRRANERLETVPYHGIFRFYTSLDNGRWMEFKAKFTNGKLDKIIRVPTPNE